MSYRLGVDLGTTFTSAAVFRTGWPAMVPLGNRAMQVPSVLFLKPDGEFLVGEPAELRGVSDPDRVVREFKRRIGDRVPILVAGSPHSPQALQAHLLTWVVDRASHSQGSRPDRVTLTYPASWGEFKLDLFAQTIRMADVTGAELCTEPEAAATLYAARNVLAVGDCVAIYDLGGGTFDAAIMQKTPTGFDRLGEPAGIELLGGVDFDEAVFHHVLANVGEELADAQDDPTLRPRLAQLRRECVAAKEALSNDSETVIPVALGGLTTSVRLVRDEFEDMIRPAVANTVLALRGAVDSAGLVPTDLRAIVLTGGSSRIPLISQELARAFDRPLALDTHPKHDVALGAALHNVESAASTAPRSMSVPTPAAEHDPPAEPAASVPAGAVEALSAEDGARQRRPVFRRAVALVALAVILIVGITAIIVGRSDHVAGGDGVPVKPPASTTATKTTTSPTTPQAPLFSDSTMLITSRARHHFTTYRVTVGTKPSFRKIILATGAGVGKAQLATISPDRDTVVYLTGIKAAGPFVPWVKPRDEPATTLFTSQGSCSEASRPAFSPDGTELAVICLSAETNTQSLLIVDLHGTLLRTLVDDGTPYGSPTWTSDGRIIFERKGSTPGTPVKLWSVPAQGSADRPTAVTHGLGWDSHPDWSNATDSLLFLRTTGAGEGREGDVYSLSQTGKLSQITDVGNVQAPTWSPDGLQIAYLQRAHDGLMLAINNAAGTKPTTIRVPFRGTPGPPAWGSR